MNTKQTNAFDIVDGVLIDLGTATIETRGDGMGAPDSTSGQQQYPLALLAD